MVQACTDSLYVVTNHLFTLINAAKTSFTPQVEDVFYGDQKQIPRTPAITVAASQKSRELNGVPRRIKNTFDVFINIYFSKVGPIALNHQGSDQLAEAVEALVHADITLDGLVIDSLVILNEAGFLNRENSQFRGNRLIVRAMSKKTLPMAPGYNQP
jgi:hypothetical protein